MEANRVQSLAMTDDVRDAVLYAMYLDKEKRKDLAERIGKSPQYISGALNGNMAQMPEIWAAILHEKGLKLIAVPADADIDYHHLIREAKVGS